jgi:hypothetical protein
MDYYFSPDWPCENCGVRTPTREGGIVCRDDHECSNDG